MIRVRHYEYFPSNPYGVWREYEVDATKEEFDALNQLNYPDRMVLWEFWVKYGRAVEVNIKKAEVKMNDREKAVMRILDLEKLLDSEVSEFNAHITIPKVLVEFFEAVCDYVRGDGPTDEVIAKFHEEQKKEKDA